MADSPKYNLHSHTARCGHAVGTDREYVENAIRAGFTTLGFSDHVMLPWVSQPRIRGEYAMLADYLSSVASLRKEYAGVIDIHTGFEAEWYGTIFKGYYQRLLLRDDFEYFLLGQHCFYENNAMHWYGNLPKDECTLKYRHDVLEAMDSGLFTYFAHPDIYISWRECFDALAEETAEAICAKAKAIGMPLEINCAPSRRGFWLRPLDENLLAYPVPQFWDIAAKHGVDVVIGVDAHDPSDYLITRLSWFVEFAKRHGLHLLEQCPLKAKK